jgi:uncharacterized protein YneR
MLTFDEKWAIIASFPQLQPKNVSMGRINFHYESSAFDKKIVVYHLHPNGNGFVYAGRLEGVETDENGLINIRDYDEAALQALIQASIRSLSQTSKITLQLSIPKEERWKDADDQILVLVHEDDLWNVYTGENLEMAFETYEEAEDYLQEEGFKRLQ